MPSRRWRQIAQQLTLSCTPRSAVRHHVPARNDTTEKVPVLEFGKMDHGRFALDFRHPICPIQAFGVFLSAFGWYPADD